MLVNDPNAAKKSVKLQKFCRWSYDRQKKTDCVLKHRKLVFQIFDISTFKGFNDR